LPTALSAKKGRGGGFAKQSAAPAAGFGAKTAVAAGQQRGSSPFALEENAGIERCLRDPRRLRDDPHLAGRMRAGEPVVIRDAFRPDLAEAMHRELVGTDAWSRSEDYFGDGYGFRHYNIYDRKDYSPLFLSVLNMFGSEDTKRFMTEITGRDCTGETVGAPSYYDSGDHSLPHVSRRRMS
jgi:hypothetical protein